MLKGKIGICLALTCLMAAIGTNAETIKPSSGLGKFDAEITGQTLKITLPVYFSFRSGDPSLAPGHDMEAYHWNSTEMAKFKKTLSSEIGSTWSGKFLLEEKGPTSPTKGTRRLRVEVRVEEQKQLKDAYWNIFALKYPDDAIDTPADVCGPARVHHGENCAKNGNLPWGTVRISTTHEEKIYVMEPTVRPIWLDFEWNSTELKGPSKHYLERGLHRLAMDGGWHVLITGLGTTEEAGPAERFGEIEPALQLARNRSSTIEKQLVVAGVDSTSIRTVNSISQGDGQPGSVTLLFFDPANTVSTLAHEAGHMLGLDDEAHSADCLDRNGTLPRPEYSAMIYLEADQHIVQLEDTNGLMSRGQWVERWHYAPFVEAAEKIEKKTAWRIVDVP